MALLSNYEIRRAVWNGAVRFNPEPAWEFRDVKGRGIPDVASVPLRLGHKLRVPKKGIVLEWHPLRQRTAEWWQRNSDEITLGQGQEYLLKPGKIVLGETLECVTLPIRTGREWDEHRRRWKRIENLAARLEGRTMHGARQGLLIHSTAPNIWPGTNHRLTVELIAAADIAIWLVPGYQYFQLMLERVQGKIIRVPSRTNGQDCPSGVHEQPRSGLHRDAVVLKLMNR